MPLSAFCSPAEKISVIPPPSFITKTRENQPHLIGPVKLIKRVKIAHSLLQSVSNLLSL